MKPFSNTNTNPKLIFLNTTNPNGAPTMATTTTTLFSHHKLLFLSLLSLFAFASLLTLFTTTPPSPASYSGISSNILYKKTPETTAGSQLSSLVFDTLINYAISSNSTGKMSEQDIRAIAGVLRRRGPCNLLIFGLGPETPLWRALNHGGRTVFIDENEYYIQHFESRNPPGFEAYDVTYTTKVRELSKLIAVARQQRGGDCRPKQNLLFSDCGLAINDLPNQLYDVAWDVIFVDGPKGYSGSSPGRMAAIFTAAVMARSGGGGAAVDVLVHDYSREVERVCSEEFLCVENLVMKTKDLAHFVVAGGGAAAAAGEFCVAGNGTGTTSV